MIAITGSCGKTQTKELVAEVLACRYKTHRSFDSNNVFFSVARTLLEVRPWHRCCVIELGAGGPGTLGPSVRLLRPDVSVVTTIGDDHYKSFRGADVAAAEKCWRIQCGREVFCGDCDLRDSLYPLLPCDQSDSAATRNSATN